MSLNVIFMGTPAFAVKSLESIINAGHKVTAVVVQPDKPKGRGMKTVFPPVKEYALSKGIQVYQPEKVKGPEIITILKEYNPDVIVVAAYGKILTEDILRLPKFGCINVHASLLPKYRGAGPIQWSIINGEKTTGITTMYMEKGLDTGDMILKEEISIEKEDTFETLHDKLAELGGSVLAKTLKLIEKNEIVRIPQGDEFTYAPLLKKEDGNINWSKTAEEIYNLIRGLNPWPGAYSFLNDTMIKIWKAKVIEENEDKEIFEPGDIIRASSKEGIFISTGKGCLELLEIQPEGSKRMKTIDYLIGHKIEKGTTFMMGRKLDENK